MTVLSEEKQAREPCQAGIPRRDSDFFGELVLDFVEARRGQIEFRNVCVCQRVEIQASEGRQAHARIDGVRSTVRQADAPEWNV